jgi:hypothetical protein
VLGRNPTTFLHCWRSRISVEVRTDCSTHVPRRQPRNEKHGPGASDSISAAFRPPSARASRDDDASASRTAFSVSPTLNRITSSAVTSFAVRGASWSWSGLRAASCFLCGCARSGLRLWFRPRRNSARFVQVGQGERRRHGRQEMPTQSLSLFWNRGSTGWPLFGFLQEGNGSRRQMLLRPREVQVS